MKLVFALIALFPLLAFAQTKSELDALFCAQYDDGRAQVEIRYDIAIARGAVTVGCQTSDRFFLTGVDEKDSIELIGEAAQIAPIAGSEPTIVIYDRDGVNGKWEKRIQHASRALGLTFHRQSVSDLMGDDDE